MRYNDRWEVWTTMTRETASSLDVERRRFLKGLFSLLAFMALPFGRVFGDRKFNIRTKPFNPRSLYDENKLAG